VGSLAGSQCCGAAFLKSFVWTHGRNWLTRSDFVFQKAVNIERPPCIQAINHDNALNDTVWWCSISAAANTLSNVAVPSLATRYWSCNSFGPSILSPTRNPCCFRKAHHSSFSSVPFVCRSFSTHCPGFLYFCSSATTSLKNSNPSKVGSPPCQLKTTASRSCPSMY